MPFYRCPSKEGDLCRIEGVVNENPQEIVDRRRNQRNARVTVIEYPWNISQFVKQTDDQENDDNMIVQSVSKCFVDEKIVENEHSADETTRYSRQDKTKIESTQ